MVYRAARQPFIGAATPHFARCIYSNSFFGFATVSCERTAQSSRLLVFYYGVRSTEYKFEDVHDFFSKPNHIGHLDLRLRDRSTRAQIRAGSSEATSTNHFSPGCKHATSGLLDGLLANVH